MNDENLKDISKRPDFKEITAKGGRNKKGSIHLTTTLKKLLGAKWEITDPRIKKLVQERGLEETVEVILVLRRILNGTEGDDTAIERIFDRIDGKVPQKNEVTGDIKYTQMTNIKVEHNPMELDFGDNYRTSHENKSKI
jgi:hypothetical protein